MMKQLAILVLFVVPAFSQPLSADAFSTLDREVAGLMDAWVNMAEGRSDESAGLFIAGTAILRAETAYGIAVISSSDALPAEVIDSWFAYLKSSADCINHFREAAGSVSTAATEKVLLASFARWETQGEKFLESVQSTR